MTELAIQAGLRKRLRHIAPEICLVAVPNAGKRGQWALNQAMKEGLRVGFPDMVALSTRGQVAFLEIKTPKGKLSPNQEEWQDRLARWGFAVTVIRSVDEGEAWLRWLNFPFMTEAAVG